MCTEKRSFFRMLWPVHHRPEIKLTLQARRNVKLAIISEFRTSITCSRCMGRLVNLVAKTTIFT
jgi:hypothetical protein